MHEIQQYQYLLADYWSPYKGLFIKDPRKMRAEWIYRETVGEDPRTSEKVAADFGLPLDAVLEAIHYCTHHEDFLRQERDREQTRINEMENRYPSLKPSALPAES